MTNYQHITVLLWFVVIFQLASILASRYKGADRIVNVLIAGSGLLGAVAIFLWIRSA